MDCKNNSERKRFDDLVGIMRRLRAPGGCPWDAEQTIPSLTRYILEEANELVEAIEDGDARAICEECGDVMLQTVFVSQIASEEGAFDIDDVTDAICSKLIRRHPHVFGDVDAPDAATVLKNWERIKSGERKSRGDDSSVMAGIPRGLPALLRALRISERAAKRGFDWRPGDVSGVRAKVAEELAELDAEIERGDAEAIKDELGDVLFATANLARRLGIDPESALQAANAKFIARFRQVEREAEARGMDMESSSLEALDELWREAKQKLRQRGTQ